MKKGKCQENEGITAELVKYADKSITKIITAKLNQAISLGKDIGINSAILISIPKPHETLKSENLRPICIVPVLRKILSFITLNRIQEAAEEFIGPTQSAFKKGRSTADIIWAHRFNMVTVYKTKKNSLITSIDISATFDTIQRNLLIETCSKFLPADDITLITYLLSNTTLTIKTCNNKSNLFEITISAPQEDSLSPIMFYLYLKEAISRLPDQLGGKELIYADDIDFVTEKPLDIIEISKQMAKYNLKVNPQKTEITTQSPTSLDNIKTKKLGTHLSMYKEIFHRKALTLVATNKLIQKQN